MHYSMYDSEGRRMQTRTHRQCSVCQLHTYLGEHIEIKGYSLNGIEWLLKEGEEENRSRIWG